MHHRARFDIFLICKLILRTSCSSLPGYDRVPCIIYSTKRYVSHLRAPLGMALFRGYEMVGGRGFFPAKGSGVPLFQPGEIKYCHFW
jgi:hypothetical protein